LYIINVYQEDKVVTKHVCKERINKIEILDNHSFEEAEERKDLPKEKRRILVHTNYFIYSF